MANKFLRSVIGAVAAAASFAHAPTAQALAYSFDYDPFAFSMKVTIDAAEACFSPTPNSWRDVGTGGCSVSVLNATAKVVHTSPFIPGAPFIYLPFVSAPPRDDPGLVKRIYDVGTGPGGIVWAANNRALIEPLITFPFLGFDFPPGSDPYPPGWGTIPDPFLLGVWGVSFLPTSTPGGTAPFASTARLWKCEPGEFENGRCSDWEFKDDAVIQLNTAPGTIGNYFTPWLRTPSGFAPDGTPLFSSAQVPEPSSVALLLGALGAGWLTRRRKTAA